MSGEREEMTMPDQTSDGYVSTDDLFTAFVVAHDTSMSSGGGRKQAIRAGIEAVRARLAHDASQIETAVKRIDVYKAVATALNKDGIERGYATDFTMFNVVTNAVIAVIGRGEPLEKFEQLPDRADVKETE